MPKRKMFDTATTPKDKGRKTLKTYFVADSGPRTQLNMITTATSSEETTELDGEDNVNDPNFSRLQAACSGTTLTTLVRQPKLSDPVQTECEAKQYLVPNGRKGGRMMYKCGFNVEIEGAIIVCPKYGQAMATHCNLLRHIKTHHGSEALKSMMLDRDREKRRLQNERNNFDFRCNVCSQSFNTKSKLNHHRRLAHGQLKHSLDGILQKKKFWQEEDCGKQSQEFGTAEEVHQFCKTIQQKRTKLNLKKNCGTGAFLYIALILPKEVTTPPNDLQVWLDQNRMNSDVTVEVYIGVGYGKGNSVNPHHLRPQRNGIAKTALGHRLQQGRVAYSVFKKEYSSACQNIGMAQRDEVYYLYFMAHRQRYSHGWSGMRMTHANEVFPGNNLRKAIFEFNTLNETLLPTEDPTPCLVHAEAQADMRDAYLICPRFPCNLKHNRHGKFPLPVNLHPNNIELLHWYGEFNSCTSSSEVSTAD